MLSAKLGCGGGMRCSQFYLTRPVYWFILSTGSPFEYPSVVIENSVVEWKAVSAITREGALLYVHQKRVCLPVQAFSLSLLAKESSQFWASENGQFTRKTNYEKRWMRRGFTILELWTPEAQNRKSDRQTAEVFFKNSSYWLFWHHYKADKFIVNVFRIIHKTG